MNPPAEYAVALSPFSVLPTRYLGAKWSWPLPPPPPPPPPQPPTQIVISDLLGSDVVSDFVADAASHIVHWQRGATDVAEHDVVVGSSRQDDGRDHWRNRQRAGVACDAQVLVWTDMVGLTKNAPKLAKAYRNLRKEMADAATEFAQDVAAGRFPTAEQSFS